MRCAVATAVALLVAALALAASVANATSASPRHVSFLPLGGFSRADAATLARELGPAVGVRIDVLASAPLPRAAFDGERNQYASESLFTTVRARRAASDPSTVVIALTNEDLYSRTTPSYRFVFGLRSPDGVAVVSTARMDPRRLGLNPDPALRTRRLRKMVVRNIGALALGLPLTKDARSVLYDTILSTDDLDYMTEEFRPSAPSAARRRWLSGSNQVCDRAVVEAKALIARSRSITRADFLAFEREATALSQRHYARLAGVPPASEDRGAARALLSGFERSSAGDRAFLVKASGHWSTAAVQRWLDESVRVSLALKSDALELGSRSCGRYFDPATYR